MNVLESLSWVEDEKCQFNLLLSWWQVAKRVRREARRLAVRIRMVRLCEGRRVLGRYKRGRKVKPLCKFRTKKSFPLDKCKLTNRLDPVEYFHMCYRCGASRNTKMNLT